MIENPTQLLLKLRELGFAVTVAERPKRRGIGRRLVVDGDPSKLTDELRTRIKGNARGLVDALEQLEAGGEVVNHRPVPEPPRRGRAIYEPPDPRGEERAARWARRWS